MPSRHLKVLIVEDDRIDREIYRRCLQESRTAKFEFAVADSAAEGMGLVRTWRPDCMLLDYDLPDMNGLEALAGLGRECDGVPCAVVMLTACGGEGLAVEAMKAGVMDYLPKGQVAAETLAQTVDNAIQKFEMQRRIEEHRAALERSQRRYETLLEAMPQMVWTANAHGVVEYANRRWLDYTGLTVTAPEAHRLGWNEVLHPDDRDETWTAWEAAKETGCVFEIEHRLRRAADGSYRWHLVRAVPMTGENGEVTHWFGTCTEVEDQKQAEKANLDREKLEGLGRLAGGIAHDFNNLLAGILGGASFVMETLHPADPNQKILEDVVHASERAADLTRKMLAYSGKANFFVELVEVNPLVGQACNIIRPTLPDRIQLELHTENGLPPVETDSEQLLYVLQELLKNAVEAIGESGSGTIWVRTGVTDVDPATALEQEADRALLEGGRFVTVEVQDTGCGMDGETQRRIFDPFFTTKFMGRGMGLAAVGGFIRSNRGTVRVSSGSGEGTLLQVLLPAGKQTAAEEKERAASNAEARAS
jgi:PAS domain S-box-containing protein